MFCGARPNMGSVRKSQCQFMLCLLGGFGGVATVQTGAVQSPDWGEKGGWNQNGQPPNQPTRPLVIWPKFTGPHLVHFQI